MIRHQFDHSDYTECVRIVQTNSLTTCQQRTIPRDARRGVGGRDSGSQATRGTYTVRTTTAGPNGRKRRVTLRGIDFIKAYFVLYVIQLKPNSRPLIVHHDKLKVYHGPHSPDLTKTKSNTNTQPKKVIKYL